MKIIVETIPHDKQRYDTAGDWFWTGNDLNIRVSYMDDWRHVAAVAVHELVEVLLCRNKGIGQAQVDVFDTTYKGDGEPGDDPQAPYRDEHCYATAVERMLIAAFGISWDEYDRKVNEL
jgi:hypothetical protein